MIRGFARSGNFFDGAAVSSRLSDYDYTLPEELIAQRPLARREDSRMMVLHRATERIEHCSFFELGKYLAADDLLVLNDTRVLNARRFSDDGAIEFLFVEPIGENRWRCLVKPGRKMRVGATTSVEGIAARVEEICEDGSRLVALAREINLETGGAVPLPPYMRRAADTQDAERYQTVFAKVSGAVAAPTAGLHFTPELLERWPHTFVTLHVGTGTFAPVKTENIAEHAMHEERFSISDEAVRAINPAQRVIAVGTTTVRVLEAAKRDGAGKLLAQDGATRIFLHPPRPIAHVDALLTNFHLPRSTLLMLVSAFAGRKFILRAYAEAIRERYRFYSYGDCMLVL
ncbi:MAG: tRNA preQ1(34) S-adenosylmethionine ribosyltransferase-isomerase QueA [Chthoniobacterales bacterium]